MGQCDFYEPDSVIEHRFPPRFRGKCTQDFVSILDLTNKQGEYNERLEIMMRSGKILNEETDLKICSYHNKLYYRGRYLAEKAQKCPERQKFCPNKIFQTFQHSRIK